MDELRISELKILCELETSILDNGKINIDSDGFYESEEDTSRLAGLYKLQEKYHYGWYIAKETISEQIDSINDFKKYILSLYELERSNQ